MTKRFDQEYQTAKVKDLTLQTLGRDAAPAPLAISRAIPDETNFFVASFLLAEYRRLTTIPQLYYHATRRFP
jgi:hypothetical protein